MKLLVLATLVVLAVAKPTPKPKASNGYQFKPPSTAYGIPGDKVSVPKNQPQQIYGLPVHEPQQFHANFPTNGQSFEGFNTGSLEGFDLSSFQGFNGGSFDTSSLGQFNFDSSQFQGGSNPGFQSGFANVGTAGVTGGDTGSVSVQSVNTGGDVSNLGVGGGDSFGVDGGNSFGVGGGDSFAVGGISGGGAGSAGLNHQAEVEKHVYFYAAPDEPEATQRVVIPQPAPKKNVKIIFIKAPIFKTNHNVQVPLQHQNEEKTVVYVLVQKPQEEGTIVLPTAPPTKPSKPEVFFIKYKNQKEAEKAISSVKSGAALGGANVHAVGDDHFLNTINSSEGAVSGGSTSVQSGESEAGTSDTDLSEGGGAVNSSTSDSASSNTVQPHALYGVPN